MSNHDHDHDHDDGLPPGCWVCLGRPENCNCPRHNEHLQ